MFFHALTFAGSWGSCLNTWPTGWVFKHRPRDSASDPNIHAWSLFLHMLSDFSINHAEKSLKHLISLFLHLISPNKMASASSFWTSLRRNNVTYTRATFSRTKASAKCSVTATTLSRVTSCIQIRAQFRHFQVKAMFKQHVNLMIWTWICSYKQLRVTNSHARMVVFIYSFQLYFIDIHIYLSFDVPHLIEKYKNLFFVVLMINVS